MGGIISRWARGRILCVEGCAGKGREGSALIVLCGIRGMNVGCICIFNNRFLCVSTVDVYDRYKYCRPNDPCKLANYKVEKVVVCDGH